MASEDVLIIGAGPAGIASAYAMEQAGIRYKVIDRAATIASTWYSLYPSLRLNTSRFFSHMPGMRFPLRYGLFPSGRDYHRYLERFVERHTFNIHLGIEVYRVSQEPDGRWCVETSEGVEHYPVVIPATGIFSNPVLPDIPGIDDFQGLMIHSHDFKNPAQVTGKRVLVVGNGPSGVDIAIASAQTATKPIYMSIRSGIDLAPRYVWGIPRHVWMLLAERLPKRWCEWLMTRVNNVRYDLPADSPLKPFTDQASGSAIPYRGPELIQAVHRGDVVPVRAPVRFHADSAELADGQVLVVDAVVLATSYLPTLHRYLDIDMQFAAGPPEPPSPCDWDIGPNGIRGWPLRDTREHPNGRQVLGYPGLYLVGVFYKGRGAMYNMNIEARIAAEQIKRYLAQS